MLLHSFRLRAEDMEGSSALSEAQRWIEAVTKKRFASGDFRVALEDGVLLCDLINGIKPGIIKRVNRLSTPIAGLDNVNVFLKACAKLGLKEAQLFHPGDLQDLSTRVIVKRQETNRRLKNVLITLFWLGKKAQIDPVYDGPYLSPRAFEGLLGVTLTEALELSASLRGSIRDSGFADGWYTDRENVCTATRHRREDSLDSLDSVGSRSHSTSSENTLKGSSEGFESDLEADFGIKMTDSKDISYRRSLVITPKATAQFNQFLPSKDKQAGYIPAPLRKKRAERQDDVRTEQASTFSSSGRYSQNSLTDVHLQWACDYESGSDSETERPDPDLVLDDLASRRFHSPSPVPPTNFAVPMSPLEATTAPRATWSQVTAPNIQRQTLRYLSSAPQSPERALVEPASRRPASAEVLFYDDSEDDDDEVGYADPVQDDLYTRKVGMALQPTNMAYDKFLPKYWTPEEEAHVQKIKLGSQRRPWYRKIQGFSCKKAGSNNNDSARNVNPWLTSPSPAYFPSATARVRQHPPTPSAAQSPPRTQPHTLPQPGAAPLLVCAPDAFPRPDPSSGPKLFKCEKHRLFGRPHDPYDDAADVLPDLENDDMFARRTNAFHSTVDLQKLDYREYSAPWHRSEPQITIVIQRGSKEYPDIEKDDLVYRKANLQQDQRPLSGAPDIYNAIPVPTPWELPDKLQSRLLCTPCPPTQEAGNEPVQHCASDNMLCRKLGAAHLQASGSHSGSKQSTLSRGPTVPSLVSEEDIAKWQTIREASQLRYKKRLMVERLLQRSSDSDGSKSLSDILTDETPTMMQQVRFEDLQKMRTMIKESEDKWQDDLTKWKNRRRSVNSDIVKKKEEREQIELLTSSGSPRKSKTFKEMQEEREMREQGISRNQSTDEDVFDEPVPRLRRIPPRSHTIDSLYTDLDKPDFSFVPLKRDEDYLAPDCKSFPTTDQTSPNTETSTSSSTGSRTSQDEANCNSGPTSRHSFNTPSKQTNIVGQSNTSKPKENTSTGKIVPEPLQPISTQAPEPYSGSFFKAGTVDTKPSGTQVSSYLPRSYQRSDSARITSVVAPRPFGVQSNRIASLPRAFTMDESYTKRFNGEAESSRKPAEPSRYAPFMTEDEARSQTSSVQSSNEDRDDEDEEETAAVGQTVDAGPSPVPLARVSPQPKAVTTPSPVGDKAQESYSDMRMILNQKPNRGYDFGFQANWDSTGAHVNVIQPGSSAELCHLQVGDEILSVNGHRVADMSYEQWKRCLEEAQKQGNLVMDIRRHGKNNWGRDLPSLPFKSHKTINLTSVDPLGGPDSCFSTNTVANSNSSSETTIKTLDVSNRNIRNQGSNGLNGGFSDELVPMRNKDSEPISLKNLKRRSEFFEQGGSESAISDLQVPSLSTSSNRWSWDPEEERRRQEKWQKEQERLLQEKYKRDQEKLDAEWQKAQQEAMKEGSPYHEEQEQKTLELDSRSISPLSPLSPTPFWDQQEQENEERRRKETEQRRQQEEEKRMKEEQQRLDKERRKREDEQHLQEEKRRKEEEARRLQKQKEEEEERRRLEREKEEELRRQEERDRLQQQDQWRVHSEVDSFSYTPVYSQLSFSHRAKSKSTPALDEAEKPEPKGLYGRQGGMVQYFLEEELKRKKNTQVRRQQAAVELEADRRQILNAMRYRNPERVVSSGLSEGSWSDDTQKKNQSHSQAELERQQILQEMKKKTQLLTDSSWIRQRETAAAKEPITLTGSMRRGESLDNLDMPRSSWRTSWTPGSTSSIPDYSRPYSTLSGSTSYGGSQRPVSVTLPTSQSMNSLRQSWSPSSSSTTNHLPDSRTQPSAPSQQQRNRAVSGKKICTFCDTPLGKGAAMVIESLGLCYHLTCFKCIDCKSDLGGSEAGAEVRIRNQQLYCNTCYVRFKSGQPTSM
ncbi:LIM domain only protein 7 isoform X4 [Denticeps clupeoides]|uniref:LIM domain only protein 7 isoform X4 n=1 Tax=Denticeps clupeoides TaxID=299321 RepID=UPI0010A39CE7|nr:LIM domain only protein 7-like isoform X4 [Denticeps clupeoides]